MAKHHERLVLFARRPCEKRAYGLVLVKRSHASYDDDDDDDKYNFKIIRNF